MQYVVYIYIIAQYTNFCISKISGGLGRLIWLPRVIFMSNEISCSTFKKSGLVFALSLFCRALSENLLLPSSTYLDLLNYWTSQTCKTFWFRKQKRVTEASGNHHKKFINTHLSDFENYWFLIKKVNQIGSKHSCTKLFNPQESNFVQNSLLFITANKHCL